ADDVVPQNGLNSDTLEPRILAGPDTLDTASVQVVPYYAEGNRAARVEQGLVDDVDVGHQFGIEFRAQLRCDVRQRFHRDDSTHVADETGEGKRVQAVMRSAVDAEVSGALERRVD